MKFEDALKMRLGVMNTSHQNMQDFLASHPPRISQGIAYLTQCQISFRTGMLASNILVYYLSSTCHS